MKLFSHHSLKNENLRDAERCMSKLQNTEYMGHELKLGWGKSVPNLGTQPPIYVPERLKWLLTPPKPSQLPLNAQPPSELASKDYALENLDQCTGMYEVLLF